MTVAVVTLLVIGSWSAAFAVNSDCLQKFTGINNPACSANDVRVGRLELVSGPPSCTSGETILVTLKAIIESGPERFDIGLWINALAGDARDDQTANACFREFLDPIATAPNCDQDGGPYINLDGDACGDVYAQGTDPCGNAITGACTDGSGGTCLFTTTEFTATVTCNDANGNGLADLSTCSSWDNNDNTTCSGVLQAAPGTGAKCNCGVLDIVGLCDDAACAAQNTICAQFSCDPAGTANNCDVVTPAPATTECRASAGVCDVAESCDGAGACPADGFKASTTECRASAGVCDVAESCPGDGATCPADGFKASTTECRASAGVC
ncbi:MAG: hypothetical protein ACREJ4_10570, partial [Candidatus Methylomirabilaceae bacterium]